MLNGTIRMVEDDTYCVDVMKQLSALQASIARANRLLLQNHLETCFSKAVAGGEGEAAIGELVDALKFSPALTGTTSPPGPSRPGGRPARHPAPDLQRSSDMDQTVTVFAVPDVSCDRCRQTIEADLREQTGVGDVQVDLLGGIVRVAHDPQAATTAALGDRLGELGYPVVAASEEA